MLVDNWEGKGCSQPVRDRLGLTLPLLLSRWLRDQERLFCNRDESWQIEIFSFNVVTCITKWPLAFSNNLTPLNPFYLPVLVSDQARFIVSPCKYVSPCSLHKCRPCFLQNEPTLHHTDRRPRCPGWLPRRHNSSASITPQDQAAAAKSSPSPFATIRALWTGSGQDELRGRYLTARPIGWEHHDPRDRFAWTWRGNLVTFCDKREWRRKRWCCSSQNHGAAQSMPTNWKIPERAARAMHSPRRREKDCGEKGRRHGCGWGWRSHKARHEDSCWETWEFQATWVCVSPKRSRANIIASRNENGDISIRQCSKRQSRQIRQTLLIVSTVHKISPRFRWSDKRFSRVMEVSIEPSLLVMRRHSVLIHYLLQVSRLKTAEGPRQRQNTETGTLSWFLDRGINLLHPWNRMDGSRELGQPTHSMTLCDAEHSHWPFGFVLEVVRESGDENYEIYSLRAWPLIITWNAEKNIWYH